MRIGVLGNEGSWYYEDLKRAATLLKHDIARLDFPRLRACVDAELSFIDSRWNVGDESPQISPQSLAANFDAVIVRTMPPGSLEQVVYRMDALAALESQGVLVVNSPKAIESAVDKYLTTKRLKDAGLSVPRTIVCEDADSAMESFSELGGDVVVKPLFGAEGRGIVRVGDPDLAWRTFRTLERLNAVLYLQEFIKHPGWDLRVMVLDGKVIGGMKRTAGSDFRTNVARKAVIENYLPSEQEQSWALRAAEAVGAWFAGVDLLYHTAGLGYVIEVNAVPGWRAFAKATGRDVAVEFLEKLSGKSGELRFRKLKTEI